MLKKHLYVKLLLKVLVDISHIPYFIPVQLANRNILVTKKVK